MSNLTPAQREAYARANTSTIHLPSVEFRHPAFLEPLRIVSYDKNLVLPLEATAPADPGESVEFVGLACDVREPDIDDQADSTAQLQIDGVSATVQAMLAMANKTLAPVDAAVRFYSYNVVTGAVSGPVGVIHQQVRSIVINKVSVSITLGYTNSANKPFPSQRYTPKTNPGLPS